MAFTLLELLVVMAIVTVTAAFMIPALVTAKERARMVVCMNNIRQIAMAYNVYASENNGIFCSPNSALSMTPSNWIPPTTPTGMLTNSVLVRRHYVTTNVFKCPGDRGFRTNPSALTPSVFSYTRNGYGIYDPVPGGAGIYPIDIRDVPSLSRTALLVEEDDESYFNDGYVKSNIVADILTQRHFGKSAMAFYDGHVSFINSAPFNTGDATWRQVNYLWPPE